MIKIPKISFSLTLFFLFSALHVLTAQIYNFEEATVPTGWSFGNEADAYYVTSDHYKEGNQSLCWEVSKPATIKVNFPANITVSSGAAFMYIYSPAITHDTLLVEFMLNENVYRKAQYLINYKGWKDFDRAYTEYSTTSGFTMNAVKLTLKPAGPGSRKLCFDQVRLNQAVTPNRIVGSQWVLDKSNFTVNNQQLNMLSNVVDISVQTPSAEELAVLNDFRTRFKRTPGAGNVTQINAAKSFAAGLNLVRNSDGSIKGKPVDLRTNTLTTDLITDYVTKLEILANAGLKDNTTLSLFRDLLDYFLDQGLSEGVGYLVRANEYEPSRTIPAKLLNLLPASTSEQKVEIFKLVRWLSFYGLLYESEQNFLSSMNADVIYLFLPHILAVAIFQSDDAVAVRELKAFKRFLERNTAYVPGAKDMLKPDGTGFHHQTHYNGYMYAYNRWTIFADYLRGTPFRIDVAAYERFKNAVLSLYKMATLDQNNTRHFANTLAGRKPFDTGIYFYYTRDLFENLIGIGGDIYGKEIDEELAAAYNFFFMTNKYPVPPANYDGFYQFNYSPMGIYRRNNWVVTMRAPTTKFWGVEIYTDYNRFGRYQSHGTLEITYNGIPANSGYPLSHGGGWDWNVVPGSTTVHYTSWKDMMPAGNTTARFDQYTKTKNFSGALSWGSCGIFATDFDQQDVFWSSLRFMPTNLEFKKSMYAFDNLIISLGSDISASGFYTDDRITATNLFQHSTSSFSGPLLLNGSEIKQSNNTTLSSSQDNWILTPQGTGYFIPKGNDEISLIFDKQTTPRHTGVDYLSPIIYAYVAKAYINHGIKTSDKKYSFVAIPGTNSQEMQQITALMGDNGGSIFKIHAQDEKLHALTYLPENITAYTFYNAVFDLNFGIVKSTTNQHLLMHRSDEVSGYQYFAASNPNLNPVDDVNFVWRATATQSTLTIKGEWLPLDEVSGVQFHEPSNGETKVTLTFMDGEPLYFSLKSKFDTKTEHVEVADYVNYQVLNDFLLIKPKAGLFNCNTKVSLLSLHGSILYEEYVDDTRNYISIPVNQLTKGVYICSVENYSGNILTFKWIK